MEEYAREKLVNIKSSRLIEELFVFIYKTGLINSRAEAMKGYNDDLTMAFAIGLWVRDTALRLRQEGIDLTKKALGGIGTKTHGAVYGGNSLPDHMESNPWQQQVGDTNEDLTWLIK